MRRVLVILLAAAALLVSVAAFGLRVRPVPFSTFGGQAAPLTSVALPAGLPDPVARWYSTIYPAGVPVITSAVVSGRAAMRVMGITFPARFRFTYQSGRGYRHYIEPMVLGLPFLRINEYYLDGEARLELPFGVQEGPQINQAANLALWAESLAWLPAALLTDDQVRWEAVDEDTAELIVPYGEDEERLKVTFDPSTGLMRAVESMRFKEAGSAAKTLWINEARGWSEVSGHLVVVVAAVTWADEGTPWAIMAAEEVRYNVPVETYIRQRGP